MRDVVEVLSERTQTSVREGSRTSSDLLAKRDKSV